MIASIVDTISTGGIDNFKVTVETVPRARNSNRADYTFGQLLCREVEPYK